MTRADPDGEPASGAGGAGRPQTRVRRALADAGRRIAVLDDDPTGSRRSTASTWSPCSSRTRSRPVSPGRDLRFVLTNTRSLPEADAVELNARIGRMLFELADRLEAPIGVVSRGDSTLRRRRRGARPGRRPPPGDGRGFDGVLLAAYFEAGRFTVGDMHWARVGADVQPVSETEFARDATFGYATSDLREFVAENAVAIAPDEVASIRLDDIRLGGPAVAEEILVGVTGGGFVVVNAVEYADLEVVVLGLLDAEAAGRSFLCRTGPSFVQPLAGLDPRGPLGASDLWPARRPGGHGLVVVGSHVGLTSRQVAVARDRGGLAEVELDVAAVADPARRDGHVAEAARRVGPGGSDVLLLTSRDLRRGRDAAESQISRRCRSPSPRWSAGRSQARLGRRQGRHHLARRGRPRSRHPARHRARPAVPRAGVGLRPLDAAPEAVGTPYVVFAGNVGDETTLASVIDRLR